MQRFAPHSDDTARLNCFLRTQGYDIVLLMSTGSSSWTPTRDVAVAEVLGTGGRIVDLIDIPHGSEKAIALATGANVHLGSFDDAVAKGIPIVSWVS